MQDLATVNHISFFIAIKIKMESTNLWTFSDFQAHKYSVNSATRYINSEAVMHSAKWTCLRSTISDINLARQMRIAIEGCELTSIKLLTYRLSCIMMNSFMSNISLGGKRH